jgi:hypothetical protein
MVVCFWEIFEWVLSFYHVKIKVLNKSKKISKQHSFNPQKQISSQRPSSPVVIKK